MMRMMMLMVMLMMLMLMLMMMLMMLMIMLMMLMRMREERRGEEDILAEKSNNPNLKGGEQYTFQKCIDLHIDRQTLYFTVANFPTVFIYIRKFKKTAARIAASEANWRLQPSPIVEKNMCIFYVVVVAVVVVVVVAVDIAEDDTEDGCIER